MNSNTRTKEEINLSHFIHLKSKILAKYTILYNKNIGYQISSLDRVVNHEALLFERFENTAQQTNLFLEYSSLPIIMSNLAICVLQGRLKYLKDYPNVANYRLTAVEDDNELILTSVLKRLLLRFITSDIAQKKPWKGETDFRRVFYLKSSHSNIEFYPHLIFNELTDLLFETTTLKINPSKSKIGSKRVKVHLEISCF